MLQIQGPAAANSQKGGKIGRVFGISQKARWCCRRELNSRPLPYQGSALPLSYGSVFEVAGFYPIYASKQANSGRGGQE